MQQSNKKLHNAWAMYDWANSAYNLVITSTIFPAYYIAVTTLKDKETKEVISDKVDFFGWSVTNSALFDYAVAAAYLLFVLLSPVLSSIADIRGNKKTFLGFFCFLGAAACCGLYFFTQETVNLGVILSSVAALGYAGSLVFYNAYLPEIARPEEQDALSAKGFSFGYLGSVLLQIVCFLFVLKPELFGLADGAAAARLSFLLVGLWWALWALIPLSKLPKGKARLESPNGSILTHGFQELAKVWRQVKKMPLLKSYLAAFFFYSMGVQTVMLAATVFGSKELRMESSQLIATILVIQLVAILGAWLMSRLSQRFGNLQVLLLVLLIWICVPTAAYFITTANQFYVLAAVVGLVMGGIQSLSRSTYSKLIPREAGYSSDKEVFPEAGEAVVRDTTSFFSFYDVTEKLAIVIGMFSFGLIESITGSMRNSILALIIFFAIGALILYSAQRRSSKQSVQSA